MKNLIKKSIRLFICAMIISVLVGVSVPEKVFASTTRTVKFTAAYVSGDTRVKNIYYILDGGSTHLLGTVSGSSSSAFTFDVSFTTSIRVYVEISDNAIYNEHLYINGNQVASGDVGNSGLTFTQSDNNPPEGHVSFPIAGTIITQCPLPIVAQVSDDSSGIDWVLYAVYYDGIWHQIATDDGDSGANGWSTLWDCSSVPDQEIKIAITAKDYAGNRGIHLGGDVIAKLVRGKTALEMTASSTPNPTATPVPPTATLTSSPTVTPVPPTETLTPSPTATSTLTLTPTQMMAQVKPSPTPKRSKTPQIVITCPSALAPLMVGVGVWAQKKRPQALKSLVLKTANQVKRWFKS